MTTADRCHPIIDVKAMPPTVLSLHWLTGIRAEVDLTPVLLSAPFDALHDRETFGLVSLGAWGYSVAWPNGIELGADTLWHLTLTATGHDDARQFIEWRLRHGLSLTKAAEALGLSRRMVAYYSNAEKPVPKSILLACKGCEVERAAA